jgi:hypothetical protein
MTKRKVRIGDLGLPAIVLYWLPAAGASEARLYWESSRRRNLDPVQLRGSPSHAASGGAIGAVVSRRDDQAT